MWHNLNSTNYGVGALGIAHLNMIANVAKKNGLILRVDTAGTTGVEDLSVKNAIENKLGITISHIEFGFRDIAKKILSFRWNELVFLKKNKYDLMFDIGEGDSFADIYGLKRYLLLSLSKWLAIRIGLPLVIAPQTIGPFKFWFSSHLATYLLKKSKAVYVRDHKSGDYLKKMKVAHHKVSDVAFSLPYDQKNKVNDSVGINISGLLWNGGYTKKNQFNLNLDYKKLITEIINGFIERGRKVYLIAHVISDTDEVEDDYQVAEKIKTELYCENQLVIVAPKFTSPIEVKSFISSMEFFIGSRMHATIGAISAGVPTIPLAYSRKFSGVFESISYPHTYDLYGTLSKENILINIFKKFDNNLQKMEQEARQASSIAKGSLVEYEKFLLQNLKCI